MSARFTTDETTGILRLIVGTLLISGVAAATGWLGPLVVMVAAIPLSIGLHEFGHLLAAKASGMKVSEYFIGFGPRLWSFKRGETDYGVKAIPVGGYCRIIGMNNLEDVDPADEARSYRQQTYPRRLITVSAGVLTQFVLAYFLMYALHVGFGIPEVVEGRLEIGEISRLETGPSPAEEAGLRPGDEIVAVDGRQLDQDELAPYIRQRPGQPVRLTVERDGERLETTVVPTDLSKVRVEGGGPVVAEPVGFVGIKFGAATAMVRTHPVAAVGRAAVDTGRTVGLVAGAFTRLFSFSGVRDYIGQFSERGPVSIDDPEEAPPRFISPIGLVTVAKQASGAGPESAIWLLISINVFVGMFNLVPLLPLDGGHIAVATYERIRSRRGRRYQIDAAKLMPLTVTVLGLIIVLGITALYLDAVRPLSFE